MKIFPHRPDLPFVALRKVLFAVSAVLVSVSLFLFFIRGLNYGTDFLGGIKLQYLFSQEVSEEELRTVLGELNLKNLDIIRYGDPKERRLIVKIAKPSEESASAASLITPKLAEKFGMGVILEMEETVGPKVGAELRRKAVLAILFSLFCILIYTGFRLDFQFAPAAILALFHDVMIPVGVFSLLGLEFDLTILAALLTIVGFSINDSIVVFDRIREHARLINPDTLEEVVNQSLNETFSRTILTSLTVFFVVVILYLFGGATIKGFAFALILGTILGSFSTFSVVCPAYIWFYRLSPKLRAIFGKGA